MTIHDLFLASAALFLVYLVWQHANASRAARMAAARACERDNLVLLDQSVIFSGIRARRSSKQLIELERRFRFEFASTGERRYQGKVIVIGQQAKSIELEPYRI